MRYRLELMVGGAALGLLASCFALPSTLGAACVQSSDCDVDQSCQDGLCIAGSDTQTTNESETDTNSETETGEVLVEGELRIVHAAPDLGPVDVYVEGSLEPLFTALSYAGASGWIDLEVGSYTFELRSAGTDSSAPAIYTSAALTVGEGERVSAVAAGLVSTDEDSAGSELRMLPVLEEWGTELAGRARVRVVHAGADAPELLVEGLEGDPFSVGRFEHSPASGVPLDVAGGERIELFEGEGEGETLTTFTTPQLAEGDQVLVVATGLFGSLAREDEGFSLVVVGQNGALGRIRQDPQVFTLHGARDADNLENCTNGFELAVDFDYGEVQSAFLSPGEYDFSIFDYPSGCTGPALNPGGNASGGLEAGERYLLLITGEKTPDNDEPAIQVAVFRDRFSLFESDAASIRFVHGASAEQIFVGNVSEGGQILEADVYTSPIAWRAESEESALSSNGSYLLGVADAAAEPTPTPPLDPLVTYDYVATPGAREWGIISGDPSPDEGDGVIQLMIIDTATPDWDVELVDINP